MSDTTETDAILEMRNLGWDQLQDFARRLERERDEARRKYKQAKNYIEKMDAVIDDLKCAQSCINPLEDLKRATTALKERAEKAEAALADAAGINSIHNACMFRAGCRQAEAALSTQLLALQAANSANVLLRDVLIHKGFVECCGAWHHRYGLPERWAEIKEVLIDADVLNNDTGNMPLNAIKKLIAQLAERDAEIARLRESTVELVWAARPFAKFADAFEAKPLNNLNDSIYGIHAGTEWEAELKLSDCKKIRAAIDAARKETK